MPRDGSGVYTKPAGTTAVPNTTIESAKYNSAIDDIAADLNLARPVVAGGTGATSVAAAQTALSVDNKAVYATKSGNYTAVANDNNAIHYYTAPATVSIAAAATLGANWHYTIVANGAAVTIDPNASETINGSTTLVVPNGTTAKIICDGSNFFTVFKPNPWEFVANVSVSAASSADVIGLAPFRKLRVHGAITLSASNALAYRVSSDNGSSFYSGASDYALQYISGTATSVGAASAAAAFGNFSNTIDAGTTIHFFAQFENFNVASGDKGINVDTKQRSAGSVSKSVWGNAINLSNAMNALRLLPSVSGTMTGQFSVEGWRG